jgi:hypothetical protein
MKKEYEKALKMVADAINNEGVNPKHHKIMDDKLRKEWPVLWRAVHYAADIYKENNAIL